MLKKSTYLIVGILVLIIGTSAVLLNNTPQPPTGHTGVLAPSLTCANAGCHGTGNPNTGSGSVTVLGLPATYAPNTAYPFSLTITNPGATRTKWGFAISAKGPGSTTIGSFSTTNNNAVTDTAAVNTIGSFPGELTHYMAPLVPASTSYTYSNLIWTSPAAGGGTVNFFFAGNAADGDATIAGDFIYTGTKTSTESVLPITLYSFSTVVKNNSVLLSWQTAQEINSDHFTIQKSNDNRQFDDIGKIDASGNSSIIKNYSFTDDNPSSFEKPIYYRLAMVDKDGAKIYSKIANVILRATSTFIKGIYPNPLRAGSTLHVNFVSKDGEIVFVKLIDNAGRLVKNNQISVQKGSNILDIKMPESSTGNYKLIIKSGAGLMHEPVMIR